MQAEGRLGRDRSDESDDQGSGSWPSGAGCADPGGRMMLVWVHLSQSWWAKSGMTQAYTSEVLGVSVAHGFSMFCMLTAKHCPMLLSPFE